jgi:phospholipid/cholesterol/gamma-HCH transport system ATP-binding protein
VLLDGTVKVGTIDELSREPDPWIHDYFHGPRARAASRASTTQQPTG